MMNSEININSMFLLTFSGEKLTYSRNNRVLFQNINFSLKNGDILQITGENGAGKTTLLKLLTTLTSPAEGVVLCNNENIHNNKFDFHQKMLYIGHQNALHPELTIIENLKVYSRFEDALLQDALQRFELSEVANRSIRTLSLGQQRRAALTKLVLIPKEIWILDEPFTNLDTHGIKLVEELLLEHRSQGGISVIATHQVLSLEHIKSLHLK